MTPRPALIVDTGDPTPPYEQLRRQFTELIEAGVLRPGDRLPPVRQLAADLGLAIGTVARTYRELDSAGLITSRRGGGTRVTATVPELSEAQRAHLVHEHAEAFVQRVVLLGADQQEILDAVARAIELERANRPTASPIAR
jgi:DNA-binding transcriptional regulator YhcF (GntR family)